MPWDPRSPFSRPQGSVVGLFYADQNDTEGAEGRGGINRHFEAQTGPIGGEIENANA